MAKVKKTFSMDQKYERKFRPGDNFSDIVNAALGKYFYEEQQRQSAYLQLIKDNQRVMDAILTEIGNAKSEVNVLRESMRKRTDFILNMGFFSAAGVDLLKEENKYKKLLMEEIETVKEEYKKLKELEEAK